MLIIISEPLPIVSSSLNRLALKNYVTFIPGGGEEVEEDSANSTHGLQHNINK